MLSTKYNLRFETEVGVWQIKTNKRISDAIVQTYEKWKSSKTAKST